MIDADNSGTITFDELKEGLKRVGTELMESEIKDLMDAVRQIVTVFGFNQVSLFVMFCLILNLTIEQILLILRVTGRY